MRLVKDLPEIFEQFSEQKRESFLEVKKYKEAGEAGDRSLLFLFSKGTCHGSRGHSCRTLFIIQ